jgi:CheY-like chemotaxis protein
MESVVETARDTSRVLVVDDEPCIRDALSAALSTEGYAVRTAGEGGEALASFDSSASSSRTIRPSPAT